MVSVVLLFGRLSADNEITAMRACGVSIIQIISPILLITFLMTLLCLYLQVEIGPPLLWKSRSMMGNEAAERPMALFEPGSPFSYSEGNSNITISIEDRIGENELRGVHFCKTDRNGNIQQEINATRGFIQSNQEEMVLYFTLYDCMIVDRSENGRSGVSRGYSKEFRFPFNYGKEINGQRIGERAKYMPVRELLGEIRRTKLMKQDTTKLEIELNKRVAFALSPITFLLLGMPLAIRTSRRETSVGLFLSVILAGAFFLSIILCESLESFPKLYPQYLLWLPNIVFQIVGAIMTVRISKR
jgi:lipopolysaccharide export LptBFGC system permease protein LptF